MVGISESATSRKIRVYDETSYLGGGTSVVSRTPTAVSHPFTLFNAANSRTQNNDVVSNAVGLWGATALSNAQCDTLWNNGDGLSYADLAGAGLPAPTAYYDADEIIRLDPFTIQVIDKTGNGNTFDSYDDPLTPADTDIFGIVPI
jgi:hypothetical protein